MSPTRKTCLPAASVVRAPAVKLPKRACDSHFHVFGGASDPALVAARDYTPRPHSYAQYRNMADRLGLERGVIVQPSIYGTNNDLLVAALRADARRLRGIAVLAGDAETTVIAELDALNVRGLRINLLNPGPNRLEHVGLLGPRIRDFGWHIQLQVRLASCDLDLPAMATQAKVPIVIDHLGMLSDAASRSSLTALKRALDTGNIWVKLSAPYRCGAEEYPYTGVSKLALELVAGWSDRLLWGSDWPHPGLTKAMPNDSDLLELLDQWEVDTRALERIFVGNPDQLYWRQ